MTPPARNGPAGAVTPGDPVLRPYPVVAKDATESRLREVERLVAGATTMDGIRGPHWGRRGCGSAIRANSTADTHAGASGADPASGEHSRTRRTSRDSRNSTSGPARRECSDAERHTATAHIRGQRVVYRGRGRGWAVGCGPRSRRPHRWVRPRAVWDLRHDGPEAIRVGAGEVAVDRSDVVARFATRRQFRATADPGDARLTHHQLDLTVPTAIPRPSVSSACTRRWPYVPRDAVWISRTASVNHAWRTVRCESGRSRQA